MEENNYKGNSRRQKELENSKPKAKKVITNGVSVKKKGEIRKMADEFISENVSNLKSYAIKEVIIPNIKRGIMDIVSMFLNEEPYYNKDRRGGRRDYNSISRPSTRERSYERDDERDRMVGRPSLWCEDFEFRSRIDAERVIDELYERIREFKMVSIADLYDLVDVSCDYTYNNYGWTDISNLRLTRSINGNVWVLRMPKAKLLTK